MRRRGPVVVALVLALVLAVTGIVIGVVLAGGGSDPGGGDPGGGEATGTSVPDGVTDESGAPAADAPTLAVGDCLDPAGGVTACDAPHSAEVYSTTACDEEQVLAYLGGRVGSDVLRSDLVLGETPIPDGAACTVGRPEDELDGPNEGVLGGDAGDVWRRCLDAGFAEVPCSEEHTAEVVFVRGDGTEALNCSSRADEYLGTPFDRHADDLQLVSEEDRCLIAVRGNNVLTASVRDLRSTALPLEAASD